MINTDLKKKEYIQFNSMTINVILVYRIEPVHELSRWQQYNIDVANNWLFFFLSSTLLAFLYKIDASNVVFKRFFPLSSMQWQVILRLSRQIFCVLIEISRDNFIIYTYHVEIRQSIFVLPINIHNKSGNTHT